MNALGQNGTTGGVGGQVVTVATTEALLDAIDTVGPLIIQVRGRIAIDGPGRLVQRNNVFTGSGPFEVAGSVAEPRAFYSYTVDSPASVPATVRAGVGIGKV